MYFVYILASQRNGTLYIGVTNNLARRVEEHKDGVIDGFTKKYGVHLLVYYETYSDPVDANAGERNMKAWKRVWKIKLIEELNPTWKDLSNDLLL